MRRKVIIALAVLETICFSALAQSRSVAYNQLNYLKRESFMKGTTKPYQDVEGTPYMDDQFKDGYIFMKEGEAVPGELRFDIYANQIQFIDSGQVFTIAHPDRVDLIEIEGTIFRYLPYRADVGEKMGYFISLAEGQYSLYLKEARKMTEARPPAPYQDPVPAKFVKLPDTYYLRIGANPAMKLSTKKALLEMLGNNGSQVEEYLKNEKIYLKKEPDLIKLVNHLNNK